MLSVSTLPTSVITGFTQFVADNVDHNDCSLERPFMVWGLCLAYDSVQSLDIPKRTFNRGF